MIIINFLDYLKPYYVKIICIWKEYMKLNTVYKLFVLRIVTWKHDCIQMIIISFLDYLKAFYMKIICIR